MHTLTEKRVNKFAREFGFEVPEADKFELYVAATYLYRYVKDDVDAIQASVIGGGSDQGIDVAAVVVNNQLVSEPNDIDNLISSQASNTAKVIFIQAKTSERYDTKLVSKFLHGVESVTRYAIKPGSITLPPKLVDIANLIERIAENLDKFQEIRIPCELYYVTTSANNGKDALKELQVSQALSRINSLDIYSENLSLQTQGHEQLAAKQKEKLGPQRVQFNFERRQTIPGAEGVEDAHIGVISANELLKLLRDENGIRPGIFDDNVRLHLGNNNPVNQRIYATLISDERRAHFPFLNNGLTVVATKLEVSGDRFFASGYQIVNGGQTSNQLIRWAESDQVRSNSGILRSVWIPFKIISATNPEVRSSIAVATNLQTAIGNADIQASSQIAKDVEEYFERSGNDGLRYERQGRGEGISFARTRVVSTSELNRAVASAVFGESSKAITSSKELENEDSYVWGNYRTETFYYAAWIVYRVDRYFARQTEHSILRAAKYHIAMMVSAMVTPKLVKYFQEEDIESLQRQLETAKWFSGIDSSPSMKEKIENAINVAAGEVETHFKDILEEGRSLRKDDVRSRRHQAALLERAQKTESTL